MFVCLFLGACPAVLLPRVFGMWPVVFLTRGLPFASPYLAGCVDVQEYWHGLHTTRWTGSTCSIASRQAHVLSEGHGVGLHGFYVCIHVCMYVSFCLFGCVAPSFQAKGLKRGPTVPACSLPFEKRVPREVHYSGVCEAAAQ